MIKYFIGALIVGCLIPSVAFVVRYSRTTWRATRVGRAVMLLHGVIVSVMILAIIGSFWPDMPGRTVLRIVIYTAICVALWTMLAALVRTQRQGHASPADGDPPV